MTEYEKIRVNYYVGAVLAQGGEASLEEDRLLFSPTSPLDRALGAADVEIHFQDIKGLEYKGDLSKTLRLSTDRKIHRFAGSHAQMLSDLLQKKLKYLGIQQDSVVTSAAKEKTGEPFRKESSPIGSVVDGVCSACHNSLRGDFVFCPHCMIPVRYVCGGCRHAVEPDWKACAFCGRTLGGVPQSV